MIGNTQKQSTNGHSLGALLKSARDVMRKDMGLNGDLDRLPAFGVSSDVPPLQGGVDLVVNCSWAFSPSSHFAGFQPADWPGPKARHVTAWAGASPTSGGPGQPPPQISQAL